MKVTMIPTENLVAIDSYEWLVFVKPRLTAARSEFLLSRQVTIKT